MELTLNLVWLAVAVAGILTQTVMLSRARSSRRSRDGQWRKIVAMGCALVILFFVISMTDDLHDQALLLEERKLSRAAFGTKASAHSPSARSQDLHPFPLLLAAPFSLPPLAALGRFTPQSERQFAAAISLQVLRGRAPPAAQA